MSRESLVRPARRAEIPRLQVPIPQAPRLHLVEGPFACSFQIWRSGEPRTIDVRQHVERGKDAGIADAFLANLPEDTFVDAFVSADKSPTNGYDQEESERSL